MFIVVFILSHVTKIFEWIIQPKFSIMFYNFSLHNILLIKLSFTLYSF